MSLKATVLKTEAAVAVDQTTDTPGVIVEVSVFVMTFLVTVCSEAGQLMRPGEAQTVATWVSDVTLRVTEGVSARLFLGLAADEGGEVVVVVVVAEMVAVEDVLVRAQTCARVV